MNFFAVFNTATSKENFKSVFENNKVVHVQHKFSNESKPDFYRELAQTAGIPLIYEEDPVTGQIHVNKWTEIKYVREKSGDTYKHSNKSQPLHTDYGYFAFEIYSAFFYCSAQAQFGGATTFIDADKIVDILQWEDKSLLIELQERKIKFGRQGNLIAHNEDYILKKDNIGWKINWNYYRALNDAENKDLVEKFHSFLNNSVEKSGELLELKLNVDEAVFFHDRRVLHGRNSFVGERQLNKGGIAKELPREILQLIAAG